MSGDKIHFSTHTFLKFPEIFNYQEQSKLVKNIYIQCGTAKFEHMATLNMSSDYAMKTARKTKALKLGKFY